MTWEEYLDAYVRDGRHTGYPKWQPISTWEFIRDDGLLSAHKMESPYFDWKTTVEESMRLADQYIPLGSELPDEMRQRTDPNYGSLWGRE